MSTPVGSLSDLQERNARDDHLAWVARAGRVAIAGTLLAFAPAVGLVALLAISPAAVIPDIPTLALTAVTSWGVLALFVTAVLATRTQSR